MPIKVTYFYDTLPEGIIEDSIKAYYVSEQWEKVKNQELDVVNKRLVFYLPHFSLVGIGAKKVEDLNNVIAYPNPASEKVIFGNNLPKDIRVQIFSLTGEEIYDRNITTKNGIWDGWDSTNKAGEKVASGIYIYLITNSAGNKAIG
jgi:hypothetical protein